MTPEELDRLTAADDLADLFVTPRHLAGGGTDPGVAIRPLLNAGFSTHHDDLGNAYLDSPCRRVRAAWTPAGDDIGAWHITAATLPMRLPQWKIVVDADIPFEAVAALTTALAADLTAGRDDFLRSPLGAIPGWYPLVEAGWTDRIAPGYATFTAPDGQAQLVCTREPLSYAGEMFGGTKAWDLNVGSGRLRDHATFTTGTPSQLVAAFTRALSDPAPVVRTRNALPRRNLAHLTATPALTERPAPDPRARAARSRSTAAAVPSAPTAAATTATGAQMRQRTR